MINVASTLTFQVAWSPERKHILEAIDRGENVHPATVLCTATCGSLVLKTTVGQYIKKRDAVIQYFDGLQDAKQPNAC